MLFYRNVLSEQTIKMFVEETQAKYNQPCWRISQLFWQKILVKGVNGAVYVSTASEELHQLIIKDVKQTLPPCNRIDADICIWDKGSALNIHDDTIYVFGATIYLNQNWNINHGGLFGYEEDDQFRLFVPEFNAMVVTNSRQPHFVTPVSFQAPEFRVTIQLWGKN